MAINGTLQLNTNYIQNGLGTLTFTVPAAIVNGPAVLNTPFTVLCQVTVPQAAAEGFGAGSGADQGLGVTGTSPAYLPSYQTTGAQQGLGNGALGLGFQNVTTGTFGGFDAGGSGGGTLGSVSDNATGAGSGYGNGAGDGSLGGFALGGGGLGDGAKGLGFGTPSSGYPQPSTLVTTPVSYAAILSGLSIVVNKNGTPIYTAPVFEGAQSALQFKTSFLTTAADTITVVFSSSTLSDEQLQGVQANVSIWNGQ